MTNPISSTTEMQLIRSAEKIVAPLIQEGVFEDFERALRALLLDYIDKQINKYWNINAEFETRFKQKFDSHTTSLKNTATPSQEEEWMDWESAVILLGKWQKIREQVKDNGVA